MQQIVKASKARTYVYHQIKSPDGKIVSAEEAEDLYRKGWVDTPAKFGRGVIGRYHSFVQFLGLVPHFLRKEWKWLLGFIVPELGLYIAFLKL